MIVTVDVRDLVGSDVDWHMHSRGAGRVHRLAPIRLSFATEYPCKLIEFYDQFTWARILAGHRTSSRCNTRWPSGNCIDALCVFAGELRTHGGFGQILVIHGKSIRICYHFDTSSRWNYSCRSSWYKLVLCQRANVPGFVYIDVYLIIFTNRK